MVGGDGNIAQGQKLDIAWIGAFLCYRQQRVVVNGH